MMAAAAISEGQVLLQVPEALFITANKALNSKHCGRLVRSKELPEWQVWFQTVAVNAIMQKQQDISCTFHGAVCIQSCIATMPHADLSGSDYLWTDFACLPGTAVSSP